MRNVGLGLVLASLFVGRTLADAAPADPLRVVIRAETASDRELLERVHGQTSDLHVQLLEAQAGPLETTVAAQLRTAATLATSRDASVAFWFDRDRAGTLLVFAAEPLAERIFVRAIDPSGPIQASELRPSSFQLEAASLVVRTALKAFAAGGTIGVSVKESGLVREEPPPPPPEPLPPEPPPVHRAKETQWSAALGVQIAADGYSPLGESGAVGEVAFAIRRLELGLRVSFGVPSVLVDSLSTIQLSRHSACASGGWQLVSIPGFSLVARVLLGYAVFYRTTVSTAESVEPAASNLTGSLLAGAEARISWRLFADRLAITPVLGVDYLPQAPSLVYLSNGAPTGQRALWTWQPRVGLAGGFAFP